MVSVKLLKEVSKGNKAENKGKKERIRQLNSKDVF